MMQVMDTRERIVEAGLSALLTHGYEGMGLGPLLASIGVPKGSFYHFFDSKEAFVGSVLDAYAERYRLLRAKILTDASRAPFSRLMSYFEALEREIVATHPVSGCLYAVLALSLPSLGDDLARKLRAVFDAWERDLADVIADAQQGGEIDPSLDPREAARNLIDLYEGAALRARLIEPASAFRQFRLFATRALGAEARR